MALVVQFGPSEGHSAPLDQQDPSLRSDHLICNGFNPETSSWRMTGVGNEQTLEDFCPKNFAYFGIKSARGIPRAGSKVPILGTCCPLPSSVLTEEHQFFLEECPEGFVATGARQTPENAPDSAPYRGPKEMAWSQVTPQYMRCTKIDTQRFQLGPSTPAYQIGWQRHFRNYFWETLTSRSQLPLAFRYGIGRVSRTEWRLPMCVGYPWGSLLVRKESKYCHGTYFRQLQYSGFGNDPPKGTPVEVYAKCLSLLPSLGIEQTCLQ